MGNNGHETFKPKFFSFYSRCFSGRVGKLNNDCRNKGQVSVYSYGTCMHVWCKSLNESCVQIRQEAVNECKLMQSL